MPLLDRLGQSRQPLNKQQDIALYLERLLNTRRGTVPQNTALGLGKIPSLGVQNDPELLEQLAAALLVQIKHFEPRLQQPTFQQTTAQQTTAQKTTVQQGSNKLLLSAQLTDGSPIQLLFQLDNNQLLKVQPVTGLGQTDLGQAAGQGVLTHV